MVNIGYIPTKLYSLMKKSFKIKKHPFGGNYLAINLFGFIFTLRDNVSPDKL